MEQAVNTERFGKIAYWLQVAQDEIETIITYTNMYGLLPDGQKTNVRPKIDEIIGDEFNHCLIGLFSAAKELGIKIPTDNLEELFEGIFVEESDDEN